LGLKVVVVVVVVVVEVVVVILVIAVDCWEAELDDCDADDG
jgi:hypothetical protein